MSKQLLKLLDLWGDLHLFQLNLKLQVSGVNENDTAKSIMYR